MKTLTTISRYLVGVLFIFSGLIKANDPLGFAYKLQEYYDVFGQYPILSLFDNPFFHSTVLELSIFICCLEVIMGAAFILGSYSRINAWILLLLMLFFTFLTGFAAVTGQITECGCFGNAIPLTPSESFVKDLILLVFTVIIFINRNKITPLIPQKRISDAVLALSVIGTVIFTLMAYHHLPYIDFRPYKAGNNICELRKGIPDELKYTYVLKNKESGETKEFEKFPDNYKENWEFVESTTEVIKEGEEAEVQNFNLADREGNDITEDFLDNEGYKFLLIMYDLNKTKTARVDEVNALQQEIEQAGYPFYGATASLDERITEFRHKHQMAFPFLIADETELKTIHRANPGLMLWKGCEVVKKWHWRDLPSFESLQENYLQ